MTRTPIEQLKKTACCAFIGLAGGHFGLLTLGLLGVAGGVAVGEAVKKAFEFAGVKASETFAEVGFESFVERQKGLAPVFCEAFRKALDHVRNISRTMVQSSQRVLSIVPIDDTLLFSSEYEVWFENWDRCLRSGQLDVLDGIAFRGDTDEDFENRLKECLAYLNAQGVFLKERQEGRSIQRMITFRPDTLEYPPSRLINFLKKEMPSILPAYFDDLISNCENQKAWTLYEKQFIDWFRSGYLEEIAEIKATVQDTNLKAHLILEKVNELPEIILTGIEKAIRSQYVKAEEAGRIKLENQALKAEITRLTRVAAELQEDRANVMPELTEDRITALIENKDFDEAFRLKSESVRRKIARSEGRQQQIKPRDYYELGQLAELRFDKQAALQNFTKAWDGSGRRNAGYGLKVAFLAQELRITEMALNLYRELLGLIKEANDLAVIWDNLGDLYSETEDYDQAENSYEQALAVYNELSTTHPDRYLPRMGLVLGNLGDLYAKANLFDKAKAAYIGALEAYRLVSDSASNHIVSRVAFLNFSLGLLYLNQGNLVDSISSYSEASDAFRELASKDPDSYRENLAITLNNLGLVSVKNEEEDKAEESFIEACEVYKELMPGSQQNYGPRIADILDNIATLYFNQKRTIEADSAATQAERTLEPFWEQDKQGLSNEMAQILWTRALVCRESGDPTGAMQIVDKALSLARDAPLVETLKKLRNSLSPQH